MINLVMARIIVALAVLVVMWAMCTTIFGRYLWYRKFIGGKWYYLYHVINKVGTWSKRQPFPYEAIQQMEDHH